MSKLLTITVSGTSGTGKTTIAQELHAYLCFRGFNCHNIDEDKSRRQSEHTAALESIKDSAVITIETKQTLRGCSNREKNYMILLKGRHAHYADTVIEAWEIIDKRELNCKFAVYSPNGKDVSEFKN